MISKFEGLTGLSRRAGKLSAGEFQCEQSVKQKTACLCILAEDASENTVKKFSDMCRYHAVPVYGSSFTKEELGHMAGLKDRAVITINDAGLAGRLLTIIEGGTENEQ